MSVLEKILNGPGYSIEKIQNMDIFENLRKKFIRKMGFEYNKNTVNDLRKKMAQLSKAEINKSMINLLSFDDA